MENINNSYFDGLYKDIWRSIIPTELTIKETDFLLQYFNLNPGNAVLDLMCGYGRHSLGLARKGIEVVAVDNLEDYIDEINEVATKESLPVKAIRTDVIHYKSNNTFDLVICMGNSLNFFGAKEIQILLSTIYSQLKKGKHFLIHTWSLAEIAIPEFKQRTWSTVNGLKCLSDSRYLFHPTRIETESTIISTNGNIETKLAIDYIFSLAEMEAMLISNGFKIQEVYGIPGKREFKLGDPRAYIIAEKQ